MHRQSISTPHDPFLDRPEPRLDRGFAGMRRSQENGILSVMAPVRPLFTMEE
jgi:hypothetical protein